MSWRNHCNPWLLKEKGFVETRDGWVLFFPGYTYKGHTEIEVRFLVYREEDGFSDINVDVYKNRDFYAAFYDRASHPNNMVVKEIDENISKKIKEVKGLNAKNKLHTEWKNIRGKIRGS